MQTNDQPASTKRSERGFTVIEILLGVVLLMVPAALISLGIPHYYNVQQFTSATSKEVSRSLANNRKIDVVALATQMADDYNIRQSHVSATVSDSLSTAADPSLDEVVVTVAYFNAAHVSVNDIERGGAVEVDVRIRTAMVLVPWADHAFAGVISSRHVEFVDQYGSFDQ